jgi:endoglucanase
MKLRSAAILALAAVLANTALAGMEFVPSNPPAMMPLTNRASPAYAAAKLFMHGVNLGNYLEAPPGENWGVTCAAGEFARMRAQGFDHVRVPVGWHHYTGPAPDYTLSPEIFGRADFVVTNALAAGLAVIINIHHFNEFTSNPPAQTEQFIAIWRQVAAHYEKFPGDLAFELLNEPKDAATTAVMNPVYARAIAEIRKTNPRRTLFAGPGHWNSIEELKNLVLPPDDNVIVTVHCYSPAMFTHQGASWMGPDYATTNIYFPGPPGQPLMPDPALSLKPWVTNWIHEYNTLSAEKNPCGPAAFAEKLKLARAWSDYYGRPVHVGEFGVNDKVDPGSRARYLAAFRHELDAQGIGWCLWDWSAAFHYWDKQENRPLPGLHEALFGPPPVRPSPHAGIPRKPI